MSFRSTCASLRRPPECNKQRMPAATPHVGQGTENNCFAVRLLVLIWIGCDKTSRKTVSFRTLCAPAIGNCRSYRTTVGDGASPPANGPNAQTGHIRFGKRTLRRLHCVSAEREGTPEVHGKMDLSKHMLFQSVRLVGAVGIEPTTFGLKGRCSTTELRP